MVPLKNGFMLKNGSERYRDDSSYRIIKTNTLGPSFLKGFSWEKALIGNQKGTGFYMEPLSVPLEDHII